MQTKQTKQEHKWIKYCKTYIIVVLSILSFTNAAVIDTSSAAAAIISFRNYRLDKLEIFE